MTMIERRKFRRKNRPEDLPSDDEIAPVPPLETREERLTRRAAEAQAARQEVQKAAQLETNRDQRRAEATARARARAAARKAAEEEALAEASRLEAAEAEARARAEDEARKAEAAKRAAEEAARAEAEQAAAAARQAEAARRAEAHQRRLREIEEARQAEEQRKAEEARLAREQHDREVEAARAARIAEEQRAAEAAEEQQRAAAAAQEAPAQPAPAPRRHRATERPDAPATIPLWDRLAEISVDRDHLDRNRIVTASREDPAHAAFDVLRTRLLQALADHGWKRVAITSPTKDCGKTFTAANLAISLSRQKNCRTLLLDFDLRRPTLHKVMGAENPGSMGDMLRGLLPPENHLVRLGPNEIHVGQNIAFGFNGAVEPYAAELLQDPQTVRTLAALEEELQPDVMLFDLPPALYYDDVMAFRPHFDGVLLVVGGGQTSEKEIREVERLLGEGTPLLGIVLNKAEGTQLKKYSY